MFEDICSLIENLGSRILGTFFWNAAVLGFILHKALEISRGLGIAAAVFILIFTIAITQVTLST